MSIYPNNIKDSNQDQPASALVSSCQLNEGDLIALATDGLWDNLNDNQLLDNLKKEIKVRKSLF